MKIFSACLAGGADSGEAKAVIVDKAKDMLTLRSARTLPVDDFIAQAGSGHARITLEYADLLADEAELPPVSDEKTASLLIKNKLHNMLKPDTDYTFIRRDISDISPSSLTGGINSHYSIYAVPSEFLDEYINDRMRSKLSMVTFDRFPLAALSKKVDPVGLVCHVYADRRRIILSFSAGANLIYARTADIHVKYSAGDELNDFFYEVINLTWLYVRQTRQLPVSAVVFSGTLKGRTALEERVKAFCGQDIRYLNASDYVKNCDDGIFQEYLPAIGCALTEDSANFLPAAYREQNAYKTVLKKINIALCILLVAMLVSGTVKFHTYTEKLEQLTATAEALDGRLEALDSAIADTDTLYYTDNYIKLLAGRDKSPMNLIIPVQEALGREHYSLVRFHYDTENSVSLGKLETFKTYTAGWLFAAEYNDYLAEFGIRGGMSTDLNSILNIPERKLEIKAEIGKSGVPE